MSTCLTCISTSTLQTYHIKIGIISLSFLKVRNVRHEGINFNFTIMMYYFDLQKTIFLLSLFPKLINSVKMFLNLLYMGMK